MVGSGADGGGASRECEEDDARNVNWTKHGPCAGGGRINARVG